MILKYCILITVNIFNRESQTFPFSINFALFCFTYSYEHVCFPCTVLRRWLSRVYDACIQAKACKDHCDHTYNHVSTVSVMGHFFNPKHDKYLPGLEPSDLQLGLGLLKRRKTHRRKMHRKYIKGVWSRLEECSIGNQESIFI